MFCLLSSLVNVCFWLMRIDTKIMGVRIFGHPSWMGGTCSGRTCSGGSCCGETCSGGGPVPAGPVPAEPVPAEPVPAGPVPAGPVPAGPVPGVFIPKSARTRYGEARVSSRTGGMRQDDRDSGDPSWSCIFLF